MREFIVEIERALEAKQDLLTSCNVYNELAGISAVYLTTNIDKYFDSTFDGRITHKEFTPENIVRDKLYKIHGTIDDEKSIVLTLPEYFRRYRNKAFREFLKKIFSEYSVVFIGYGLDEYEVLDFLLEKYSEEEHLERKHWILLPYYNDEKYLLKYDRAYFNSMGINVIGYKKDQEGYKQLHKVIKKWQTEFRELSPIIYEDIKEMEETVDTLE
ncbi:MAG: SIR2 family protein [Candidatus Bathyarchaeota archaeon]|nr:SIR2 family protein [Candidatus Bathyarchaeota archaeon]